MHYGSSLDALQQLFLPLLQLFLDLLFRIPPWLTTAGCTVV